MDLMFAKTYETRPDVHEAALRNAYIVRPVSGQQRIFVAQARMIAAENAAWWSNEWSKYPESCMVTPCANGKINPRKTPRTMQWDAKRYFARQQCKRWMKVHRHGQLYASDTVSTFDPKYGET